MARRVPEAGASTSCVALSVSISKRMSPLVTRSPGRLRHSRSVASVIVNPWFGTSTSTIISLLLHQLADGPHDLLGLRDHRLLQWRAERMRDRPGIYAADRGIEVVEAFACDLRRELGGERADGEGFVDDQQASG